MTHTIGIQAFRDHLSEYLRRVDRGEVIRLTRRGEVVAEISPPRSKKLRSLPPELERLVASGKTSLGKINDPSLYPDLPPVLTEGTAQELLDQDRTDRC